MKLQARNNVADPALILLLPKDLLHLLTNITTYKGAWKHYKGIKDNLGKEKHQKISVKEFADYEGVPEASVMQQLFCK